MKIGFENKEWEKRINENFDLYIEMIKSSEPGSVGFNFASEMLRNQLDFMRYNRDIREVECLKPTLA